MLSRRSAYLRRASSHRRVVVSAVAAMLLVAALVATIAVSEKRSTPTHTNVAAPGIAVDVPPALTASVEKVVESRTGTKPPSATVYRTDRQTAEAATSGDVVAGTEDVYLYVFEGQFIDHLAHSPSGDIPPPQGKYVTVIMDTKMGTLAGWGIADNPVETKDLGSPMTVAMP